ncbi:MAG: glycerol-3-phosphate 1-O-acyltransferase PlsY [Hyphomicrobiaceae bacterium]|nr:glycerol-3-phosphate 1-O-acyltransferase PlsY [Hyphomicrobiaceae bacterium]
MTLDFVLPLLLCMGLGYLLGSVPFGLLLTQAAGLGDIRAIGSGNIGATNVLRTGHKGLAAATLVLDALKGTAAVWVGDWVGAQVGLAIAGSLAAGVGAFLGHLFPIWLGFKGGKGVATYIGILIGLYWPLAVVFCGLWLLVAGAARYSSLSALVAAAGTPVAAVALHSPGLGLVTGLLSLLLIFKHHANIGRLLAGTEPRIGAKS